MIQFRDLKKQYICLKDDIDKNISEVLEDSSFILGKKIDELETKLSSVVNRKYCVTCANGTDALQLAMMALGIGQGDAFFVPDFTFFASAGAGSILGATPVFVDIEADTFNISPEHLEVQIKNTLSEGKYNPKAIIAVDLFGQPADYDDILSIANKYNLYVIEDGAQGFGGNIRGKMACSFGVISTTSFFPAKPLGCYGDGGAIFTDDYEINLKLRSLRSQGKSIIDKYDNLEIGINSRLDTIQAGVLLAKLDHFFSFELDELNRNAQLYTQLLKDCFKTPSIKEGYFSSWAQYTILIDESLDRDAIKNKLLNNGIPSMVYYPRGLHQQKAYERLNYSDNNFPNTLNVVNRCLSLPIHPYLEENEIRYISNILCCK